MVSLLLSPALREPCRKHVWINRGTAQRVKSSSTSSTIAGSPQKDELNIFHSCNFIIRRETCKFPRGVFTGMPVTFIHHRRQFICTKIVMKFTFISDI
jgi:hypothetical protein